MIADELIKANKLIVKLRYESEDYNSEDTKEVLDILQFHLFLVITYLNKPELGAAELKERLLEKLEGSLNDET